MLKYIFVDDDAVFLNILRAFFGPHPHQFCSDPVEVLPILAACGPFDVLISDYDMPGENGLLLAEKVGKLYPDLPIVMLSGHVRPENLPKEISIWLSKPIDFLVLKQTIELWGSGSEKKICDGEYGAVEKT